MSILKRQGEKITPDFIEDDFISALETGLNRTFYYEGKHIEVSRISQSDENELGYDGVLTTLVPFYIQFKRSDFYTPKFGGHLLLDRNQVGLPTHRGFFAFELLKKDGLYGQHNAMFRLSQTASAAYVAPMFYKKSDLTKMKNYSRNYIPAYYDEINIYDHPFRHHYNFRNVLLFKRTITIPPHALINDDNTNHHYSYCREQKIGFHSKPINLENSKAQTVYYFIQNIFRQNGRKNEIQKLSEEIFNLLPSLFRLEMNSKEFDAILDASIARVSITDKDTDIKALTGKLSPLDRLLIIEDILFQYFYIRQFIKYEKS